MERFTGKTIFGQVAIGKILFYSKEKQQVTRKKIEDTEAEIKKYEDAKEKAIEELGNLYEKALKEVGEVNAQIFEVHQMMLEDEDYNDSVHNLISAQGVNADYAVAVTGDNFSKMFAEMEDEYFKARSVDVKDISERVIRILSGEMDMGNLEESVIVVANDLAPSETVQLDKEKLLGFVTELGSSNSHTAILARTMNIPAMIGVKISEEWNGKTGIIDGANAEFIVDPDEATLEKYRALLKEEEKARELLEQLKGKDSVTTGGKHIKLYANIGNVSDLASVISGGAQGIGLFRSEFLYLESDDFPSEEVQFAKYKQVAETMGEKKVIIRTLDIGADKQVDYFGLPKEDNPAMGYRAIRICLKQPDIFKTQLRALFRASAFGNIAIMYPMIISVDEVLKIKEIAESVKKELEEEGIPYGEVEQGIMIETPAAAVISDLLAPHVDFFSVGTNDLTQYTLAIDRQNAKLEDFCDTHHEAILRLIGMVIENAHKNGIWAGVCGELGADTTITKRLIDMGIDELSVSPSMLLRVKKAIREA
ncbi:MAG: phosphoenolpyruvate--protein phosphotransferase [Lachnospiraceae bacterium]|nr:phosphoenolpyruvate--protein phosphotransferase [Lachnospiraceae bacterium]